MNPYTISELKDRLDYIENKLTDLSMGEQELTKQLRELTNLVNDMRDQLISLSSFVNEARLLKLT